MPSFSFQVPVVLADSDGKPIIGPDGKEAHFPPQQSMLIAGPMVSITVGLSQSMTAQLIQQGVSVPSSKAGLGLIDTGASLTCIDEETAQEIGLPVIDRGKMTSASHEDQVCNIYPINFTISGTPISMEIPRAMGAKLKSQGMILLIGRDFLQHATMYYSGFDGRVTISV